MAKVKKYFPNNEHIRHTNNPSVILCFKTFKLKFYFYPKLNFEHYESKNTIHHHCLLLNYHWRSRLCYDAITTLGLATIAFIKCYLGFNRVFKVKKIQPAMAHTLFFERGFAQSGLSCIAANAFNVYRFCTIVDD